MSEPTADSIMRRTMLRQPEDVRRLLTEGWDLAKSAADLIAAAERVFVTGIGTSHHAALVGSWLLRAAGCDARNVLSFDLATYPDQFPVRTTDAVVVMAHTGVKRYSGEAMARAVAQGATVISVGSLTAEHPGAQATLRTVERETSAAYTSSQLCAVVALAQLATELGERRRASGVHGFRDALGRLPDQIAGVLSRESEITPIATAAIARRVYVAGGGPNEATALELVIKAREAAYAHIDALAAEQFLHGPMVAFNAGDLGVFVNVPGASAARIGEIAAVASAMGGTVWLVGAGSASAPDTALFALPELPEVLSPLLAVVPMQMLAQQMASLKGINPDTFRRDNPVYKEAFGLLKL
ncbi:MAG: SIS domain-containing protein [Thermomicrobiales bacterium]